MNTTTKSLSLILALSFLLAACTPAAVPTQAPQATLDVKPVFTAAAQTIAVELTRNAALMPTATEEVLPTATTEPTATVMIAVPTIAVNLFKEATPTPWEPPVTGVTLPNIVARLDTNCRQGPDPAFDYVATFKAGATSQVVGKLVGEGWWYIKNPERDSPRYCWVWGASTDVKDNTNYVQEISSPPTPVKPLPRVELSLSISPSISATCPQIFDITATLKSDRGTNYTYTIYNSAGDTLKEGTLSFLDDGTKTITFTKTYKADRDDWIQFRITSPVTTKTPKVYFQLDCP